MFPDVEHIKLEAGDLNVKLDPDLGVHYETVEDVSLGETTRVYLSVGLEEESEQSEILSLPTSPREVKNSFKNKRTLNDNKLFPLSLHIFFKTTNIYFFINKLNVKKNVYHGRSY